MTSSWPTMIPDWGPPMSLSPLKQGLGLEAVGPEVDERPAPQVVDDGDALLPPQADQLVDPRLLGETEDPVVRVVDAEDGARPVADRFGVVAEVGLVRRSHLPEDGAAHPHDIRHPERASDLDELAARNDDFLPHSQGVEDEDGRSGVVVDHGRGLGARELPEEPGDVDVALAAAAGIKVEGQGGVPAADFVEGLEGGLGQHRPAEAGVHDDARGVHGPTERSPGFPVEKGRGAGDDGRGSQRRGFLDLTVPDLLPESLERRADGVEKRFAAESFNQGAGAVIGQKGIDRGKAPQRVFFQKGLQMS
jgi:hypothetical protein